VSSSAPVNPSLLHTSDFTYLGFVTMPPDDQPNGVKFSYSMGALTGRKVGSDINLLICGSQAETGWPDPVYEIKYNGTGTVCTLVQNWWDVTLGGKVGSSNPKPTRGLLWDEVAGQLLWSYQDQYNVGFDWNPSFGSTILSLPTVQPFGPWRTSQFSGFTAGYMMPVPSAYQATLQGRILCGAPIGSGNSGSPWGVASSACNVPANSTPPDGYQDGHVSVPVTTLIYSDISNKQSRPNDVDDCGWTHYGEGGDFAHQPQANPVQDGSGCNIDGAFCGVQFGQVDVFTALDNVTASVWINGTTKQGVVFMGQLARTVASLSGSYPPDGRVHTWYGPAQVFGSLKMCAHGQNDTHYGNEATGPGTVSMQSSMWIYDPADLLAVALGSKSSVLLPPVTSAALFVDMPGGSSFPELAPCQNAHGGAWFEPTSKLLFMTARNSEGDHRRVVHVFSVNC
jgi:hypothetical protein